MNRLMQTTQRKILRKKRIRSILHGTTERPRLSVHISIRHMSAQIVDDSQHKTLVAVTTVGQKEATGTMTNKAAWLGTELAKKAKSAKIKRVVFDRNGKLYHGRIKALATSAREQGLEF